MPRTKRPKPITEKGKRRLAGGHGNIKVDSLAKYKAKQIMKRGPVVVPPEVMVPVKKPRKPRKRKAQK